MTFKSRYFCRFRSFNTYQRTGGAEELTGNQTFRDTDERCTPGDLIVLTTRNAAVFIE